MKTYKEACSKERSAKRRIAKFEGKNMEELSGWEQKKYRQAKRVLSDSKLMGFLGATGKERLTSTTIVLEQKSA